VRVLKPAELAALRKKFRDAGFFSWQPTYSSGPAPADGMSTELNYDDGANRHRVSTADPAHPPPALYDLVKVLLELGNMPSRR